MVSSGLELNGAKLLHGRPEEAGFYCGTVGHDCVSVCVMCCRAVIIF